MCGLVPPGDEAFRNAGEPVLATMKALNESRTKITEQDAMLHRITMDSFTENG